MQKVSTTYECQSCGTAYPKWLGRCETCLQWNTLAEQTQVKSKNPSQKTRKSQPKQLRDVQHEDVLFYPTNIDEYDTVLGQGIAKGSVILLGGEPGIGKSTLSLQLCQKLASQGIKVLYVSAEESESQLKTRAQRLGDLPETLWVYAQTNMQDIMSQCNSVDPDIVCCDSIQVVSHPELNSLEGTVSQVRHCASQLINWVKANNKAAIMIGHITKEGQLAGPKTLEHMVDVILYLEGDRQFQHRILRCKKNRYGSTDNIGLFDMKKTGLLPLKDPSLCFVQNRETQTPGSVIVPYAEGSRILLIEVQALVVESSYGNAKRNFVGVTPNRANVLIAALDKLLKVKLAAHDIFISVIGGLQATEPSVDLAMLVAVISSLRQVPVPEAMGIIGEVGLTGEIRPIPHCEKRLKELKKCGFSSAIIPEKNKGALAQINKFEIHPVNHIIDVLKLLFSNK